jgi:hypothetical protein
MRLDSMGEFIMLQPKLILGLERRSDPDLLAYGGAAVTAMKENPVFPQPWGDATPSWDQLDLAYQGYRDAYYAALTHDSQKIAVRKETRRSFVELLKRLAAYVEFTANGDVAKLGSTGFELRQEQARASNGNGALPGPMAGLRGAPTEHTGRIELHASRAEGALGYEVQTASTDPSSVSTEASVWSHVQTVFSVQRFTVDDLRPGFVWVRMRGVNNRGSGPWTSPLRVLVT